MDRCHVCFRHCSIEEGGLGFCLARTCRDGKVTAANYGKVTSLALDPIEKKPLNRFYPGSMILSVGSYGCNLRCPFCQNYEISWSEQAIQYAQEETRKQNPLSPNGHARKQNSFSSESLTRKAEYISPSELAQLAASCKDRGNIGVAFTYNEPLIGYEYVLDTAKLIHEMGMKNVLVTNGTAELSVLEELAPYVDAMNIDLKGFTDHYYHDILKGSRQMVMDFITEAIKICHVELTTLIVPGENDSEEEMEALAGWITGLSEVYSPVEEKSLSGGDGLSKTVDRSGSGSSHAGLKTGRDIPLHISRFFPRFHMQDRRSTDVRLIYRLADVARQQLNYVYTGNC